MTNYHLTPPQTLPSLAAKEACEKRRQVLAAVRQRRKRIYKLDFVQFWGERRSRDRCCKIEGTESAI